MLSYGNGPRAHPRRGRHGRICRTADPEQRWQAILTLADDRHSINW